MNIIDNLKERLCLKVVVHPYETVPCNRSELFLRWTVWAWESVRGMMRSTRNKLGSSGDNAVLFFFLFLFFKSKNSSLNERLYTKVLTVTFSESSWDYRWHVSFARFFCVSQTSYICFSKFKNYVKVKITGKGTDTISINGRSLPHSLQVIWFHILNTEVAFNILQILKWEFSPQPETSSHLPISHRQPASFLTYP